MTFFEGSWLRGEQPAAVLWRSTLLFLATDVFFTGLVGAYAYSVGHILAVLAFIAGQQLMTTVGQFGANRLMRRPELGALRTQRVGVAGLALTLALAGSLPLPLTVRLTALSLAGGMFRGVSYGARLWMEAQLPDAATRQRYLSAVEASSTTLKILAPAWALLLLWLWPTRPENVFLTAGVSILTWLALTRPGRMTLRPAGALNVGGLLRQDAFWATVPYYVVEGAGHALRMALFVCGAMSVVGTVKAYAGVEMAASCLAAGLLGWQARKSLAGPSLPRLAGYLGLLGLSWAALAVALYWPWALPVFVAGYALGMPLVSAQKAGVTLGGMVKAQGSLEGNLFLRSCVLMSARVGTLAGCAALEALGWSARTQLSAMVLLALVLLPLEYWTAHRLHRRA